MAERNSKIPQRIRTAKPPLARFPKKNRKTVCELFGGRLSYFVFQAIHKNFASRLILAAFKHTLSLLQRLSVKGIAWITNIKCDCFGKITNCDIGFI